MNNFGGPSRSMQRRSPGAEPRPPLQDSPVRSMSPAVGVAPRGSTASSRSLGAPGGGAGGGAGSVGARRANVSSVYFPRSSELGMRKRMAPIPNHDVSCETQATYPTHIMLPGLAGPLAASPCSSTALGRNSHDSLPSLKAIRHLILNA